MTVHKMKGFSSGSLSSLWTGAPFSGQLLVRGYLDWADCKSILICRGAIWCVGPMMTKQFMCTADERWRGIPYFKHESKGKLWGYQMSGGQTLPTITADLSN